MAQPVAQACQRVSHEDQLQLFAVPAGAIEEALAYGGGQVAGTFRAHTSDSR